MDDVRRKAIESADATGLVAGEELITQAETILPLLPHEDLHAALPPQHAAHAAIDRLRTETERAAPDRGAIERHVGALRALPELEARIANWWDNPTTQRFFGDLGQIGL